MGSGLGWKLGASKVSQLGLGEPRWPWSECGLRGQPCSGQIPEPVTVLSCLGLGSHALRARVPGSTTATVSTPE